MAFGRRRFCNTWILVVPTTPTRCNLSSCRNRAEQVGGAWWLLAWAGPRLWWPLRWPTLLRRRRESRIAATTTTAGRGHQNINRSPKRYVAACKSTRFHQAAKKKSRDYAGHPCSISHMTTGYHSDDGFGPLSLPLPLLFPLLALLALLCVFFFFLSTTPGCLAWARRQDQDGRVGTPSPPNQLSTAQYHLPAQLGRTSPSPRPAANKLQVSS